MKTPFLVDVRCAHAGGLRRLDYMHFHERVMGLYIDHDTLVREKADFAEFRNSGWEETEDACAKQLRWIDCLNARIRAFNRDREAIRDRLALTKACSPCTIGHFESHLKHSSMNCSCFLCDNAYGEFKTDDMDQFIATRLRGKCYLCQEEKPSAMVARFAPATFMCRPCHRRALVHGLCQFCLGHVGGGDEDEEVKCVGREDWRHAMHRQMRCSEMSIELLTPVPERQGRKIYLASLTI